jgi:superfamily II DNA or RNA helicase
VATAWKALLDAVKAECPSALWTKGVALARAQAVSGDDHDDNEWTFRVRIPGKSAAPLVVLYPGDTEWDCDCGSRFDPCEHVAACVAAVLQSPDAESTLFDGAGAHAGISYELRRSDEGVVVERYASDAGGKPQRLEQSIAELSSNGRGQATLAPSQDDLAIDRLLGRSPDKPVSPERAPSLLRALVGVSELRLDGKPVHASSEPLYPRGRVTDAADGAVRLTIEPEPAVSETVAPGVLRSGDKLHPFGAQERFGKAWERLPFRRVFPADEIPVLVAEVLPELERYITIDVVTDRLPRRQGALPPWISFEIDMVDHGVDVLPLLVYGDPPVARIDSGRLVHLRGALPQRNETQEKALLLRLRDRLNLSPGRRVHFTGPDAARFLSDLEQFDDGRAQTPEQRLNVGPRQASLLPRILTDGDEIELVFAVADSTDAASGRDDASTTGDANAQTGAAARGVPAAQTASAEAVVAAWRSGSGLVPLSDGGFARVPAGWLEAHGQLVADLLAARAQNDGRTPKAALPLLGELCEALDAPAPFELARLKTLLDSVPASATTSATADARHHLATKPEDCPDFQGELREYQAAGVAWLQRLRDAELGAILADDMGLGKTVQALCAFKGRTLVVCPRSVIHNWTREIERFRPSLKVSLYHGPQRALTDDDVTLTTYATLRNDAEVLSDVDWDVVVLDEAQAIKNPDSQVARAAYGLRGRFRLSLSGTPIENRLDELWSQMHFTNRGLLGGRRDFADRYEKPMLAGDEATTERLRKRIRPFILRRMKRDVARELPPRTEAIMYCELEADERAIYDAVRMASRADVVAQLAGGAGVLAALEALLRLRQAACHPALLPDHGAPTSSKVEALCEALEDVVADGHKALVFSQWTSFLNCVEPQLETRAIAYTRLDGSTRDRADVVDAFQDPEGPPVLLVSLTAGGTGLNLTAADHVFLLDPWWNPAVEDQAADRAHRIGQDRPVMVYRLVAKDTVEERILELQRRKRQIAEAALAAGRPAAAPAVTREDILALLD